MFPATARLTVPPILQMQRLRDSEVKSPVLTVQPGDVELGSRPRPQAPEHMLSPL